MTALEIPEGTVTVLFTDLVDSTHLNQTLGDESARQIGRQIDEMARGIVSDQRGVLIKEMGDGLMAAFASARRAVAAAREMQCELRRMHRRGIDESVQMRIGIHTGEVIGEDGDLHGETVIIAKRIEGLAPPGGILASDTVHGVLGTARGELVDHGTATLKGIEAEWRLWLVPVPDDDENGSPALAENEPTPLVGRTREYERLRAMLDSAAGGRGGMALIGGPAGVGKTRLAREAAALADQLNMAVYVGNCLDMESPPPYQPAIDHLEQAARMLSPQAFREALGVNAPEVATLLPSLRQRYDDIPATPELTPEQERRYMLHGVGEFIERAARAQPMLLVYEDLHWADESTLLLLRHLGGRLPTVPLLVIGTYRDDELEAGRPLTTAIGPLLRDVGAVDLHPGLLGVEEVRVLLGSRAGQDPPTELVDLVVTETQGNPFFVEELFRHLRDAGRLFDEHGRWRSGFEIGATEVPQGVRLVIGRRLDQLDAAHRRALASAAVIGRTFSFRHLAAVAGVDDDDDLFDALEAAAERNLVEELPEDHPHDYVFVHEQIRQTLVGELSLPRRQRAHVRAADVIEELGPRSPVEVAHHLVSAGAAAPRARTAAALLAAARVSADALAFEDALRHLAKAEALVEEDDRDELVRLQVSALRGSGRVDDALAVLDRALGDERDGARLTALRLQRVQLLNDQYRAAEGLDDLDALVAAAADDPDLAVPVQLARGRAHYILSLDRSGHAEIARDAYAAAYDAAAARGDKANMARALLPTTWFTDYWVDYAATAAANVAEALRLAEEIGDEDLRLDALAATLHRQGPGGRDAGAADALFAELEARRDPVKLNAHCFWMMWRCYATGAFERAIDMCDRGFELADLIGSAPVQYGTIKALALNDMGRYDEVEAAIDQEVTDDDHPFGQASASLARSVHLTTICAWGPAATSLAETLARATATSRSWMQGWAGSLLAVVAAHCRAEKVGEVPAPDSIPSFGTWASGTTGAEIALTDGDPARAVELVSSRLPRPGDPAVREHVQLFDIVARAHLELGRDDHAADFAANGIALAESMGFRSLLWRLLAVAGRAQERLGRIAEGAATTARAAQELEVLAARIGDPELRAWFLRQPLAAGLATQTSAPEISPSSSQ